MFVCLFVYVCLRGYHDALIDYLSLFLAELLRFYKHKRFGGHCEKIEMKDLKTRSN